MEGDTLRRPGDADGAGASIVSGRSDETGKVDLLDLPDDALRLVVAASRGAWAATDGATTSPCC